MPSCGTRDAASVEGIQEAAPLAHVPENFSKPFIVLRFTFYYNLKVPKNSQELMEPISPGLGPAH